MSEENEEIAIRKRESELKLIKPSKEPQPVQIITDPGIIKIFDHKRMKKILQAVYEEEKTIMDISEQMELNPGSVKRYIDKLVKASLIQPSKVEMNKYHIKLKYYRISALKFEFEWSWPTNHK